MGEQAFEVAQAACNLYHGVLYVGRQRGEPVEQTLRQLREGAFALAGEEMEARRVREARQQARATTAAAAAGAAAGSPQAGVAAGAAACAAQSGPQQQEQQEQQQEQQQQQQREQQQEAGGSPPRSLKRERCPGQHEHEDWGGEGLAPAPHSGVLSPTQQQLERRRRLSSELYPPPIAAMAAVRQLPLAAAAATHADGG